MTNRELKNKAEYRSIIIGILTCCILCAITMFVSSNRFVNAQITPKWQGLLLSTGIISFVWGIFSRRAYFPSQSFFLFLICFFLLILIREWATLNFDLTLLTYLIGLLLLFFMVQQIVAVCPPQYLFGVVIIFAITASFYGFLQYIGEIPSRNSNFAVTGNFDNPAGFAATLACILPLCFLFFTQRKIYLKNAAIVLMAIMITAVFLSGSRAGILAIAIAIIGWFLTKSKFDKRKLIIVLTIALFTLSVILYFFKKDSADGRLLIWRCTLDMIGEKPLFGHGHRTFQAKYMLYQANYFNLHPDDSFAQFADNTTRPFNEYLLILAEYGIAGMSLVILFVHFLLRAYRHNPSNEKKAALMSLLSLAVFSFFSYPFKYPFIWFVLFLNIAVICNISWNDRIRLVSTKTKMYRIVVFLLSIGVLTNTVIQIKAETRWKRTAFLSLAGRTREVLPEYDQLYRWFGSNGLFLYNHAAALYQVKEFKKSIKVSERCMHYYNDMDVQMLMAENFKELGKFTEAERHLKTVSAMCPSRFVPLYELVKIYNETGRTAEALTLAKIIIEKDMKIPSATVIAIKNEMRQLIEKYETSTKRDRNNRQNVGQLMDNNNPSGRVKVRPNGADNPP